MPPKRPEDATAEWAWAMGAPLGGETSGRGPNCAATGADIRGRAMLEERSGLAAASGCIERADACLHGGDAARAHRELGHTEPDEHRNRIDVRREGAADADPTPVACRAFDRARDES